MDKMIWGLTLKPGESCTKVLDEEVHLSLASMESRKEIGKIWPGSYSQVVMKTEDVEVLLCTLVHGSIFQQNLDLKLMPKENITFTVYGDCIIYIVGYTSCLPHAEEVCDKFHHDTTIYEDDVYNQVDEENHLGDNNDERPSSWMPELLPKPQDSTQSGHSVKRTENADAPDVKIIIKEEESQDVIEDIYSEDDHHHHHQQQQQQQQGCQQKMEQQEMQSVEVGESSLTGHMTQHDDSYQVSQDSQGEENFAVIADIDSFPEQVSIKKRKQYQDSQVDYVNQVDIVNFQSTSGPRVYNQVDEENHLGDNNDERPSSWMPELLPKPQDSTQSGHSVKRTENADAPDVKIIIKEEESQDVIEDIYSEDDHHHHHQQQQQQQQGCQQKMEQQEMQPVEVGESSLTGHMTQHDDSYQVSQDSQDEENFAVIADIDSFPEQVSIKKRKQYQDSQVDYVNQVNVANFQSTSGPRESKYTRSSTSISNTSNAPCTILPKITSVRSAKSFSSSVSDWTPKSTNSSVEHLKPSLVANGSLTLTLTTKLAKSTRRTANPLFLEASSESKDHKCSVCRKTFTHVSSLVRHERIHTGVKPYQCKVCFKPFSDAGNRAKHERSHMRMGKFACMYCGRTFDENTIRTQHQRMCPYMYKS